MSRNLGETSCAICRADSYAIELEEAPRPIRAEDCGRCFKEIAGHLIVAAARCMACGAKYLAWVSEIGWPYARTPDGDRRFVDLSFRSSFNDEPGSADLPSIEKLREIHARDCFAEARRLRDEAAAKIAEAQVFEERAKTGLPHWEAYRR